MIKVCKNCGGSFPCWCNKKEYINMENWIYDIIKKLRKP